MRLGPLSGGSVVTLGDPSLTYFRKVIKEPGDPLACALAQEREFICEPLRALFPRTPPTRERCASPLCNARGCLRCVGNYVDPVPYCKGRGRAESASLRVSDATYGSLVEYTSTDADGGALSGP